MVNGPIWWLNWEPRHFASCQALLNLYDMEIDQEGTFRAWQEEQINAFVHSIKEKKEKDHFYFFPSKPIPPSHRHENYLAVSFVHKAGKCPSRERSGFM